MNHTIIPISSTADYYPILSILYAMIYGMIYVVELSMTSLIDLSLIIPIIDTLNSQSMLLILLSFASISSNTYYFHH